MYVIAVLCMIKIYQNRHPDINARAPVTFGMLAVIIFAGLIGVLDGSKLFLIIFSILHLLICFFLTVQIYYMGRCKFDRDVFKRVIRVCISLILYAVARHSPLIFYRDLSTRHAAAYGMYSGRFIPRDS